MARVTALAEDWLAAQGLKPFAFQRECWRAIANGESGLVHATTGAGKTYAVWLGALARFAFPGQPEPRRKPTFAPLTRCAASLGLQAGEG